MAQVAADVLDLAARVVDELLRQAASAALTPDERHGLVSIALDVDRQAAARTGTTPNTVALAARGRAAVAGEVVS